MCLCTCTCIHVGTYADWLSIQNGQLCCSRQFLNIRFNVIMTRTSQKPRPESYNHHGGQNQSSAKGSKTCVSASPIFQPKTRDSTNCIGIIPAGRNPSARHILVFDTQMLRSPATLAHVQVLQENKLDKMSVATAASSAACFSCLNTRRSWQKQRVSAVELQRYFSCLFLLSS